MSEREVTEAEVVDRDPEPGHGSELALPDQAMPEQLLVVPLRERPFFPSQTAPVVLDAEPWMSTLQQIGGDEPHVLGLLLTDRYEPGSVPARGQFRTVGTAVRVHQAGHDEERIQLLAEGVRRFEVVEWLTDEPPLRVRVRYPVDSPRQPDDEMKAYAMAMISVLKDLLATNPLYGEEMKLFLSRFGPGRPGPLADFAASLTTADRDHLQSVLEAVDLRDRMQQVMSLVTRELEVARLQRDIRSQVEEKMSEQQRQFFLREQLKVIQKELGIAKDDRTAQADRFRERLEALTVPEAVQERIDDELDKLQVLEPGSPEFAVTRNYLDWLTQIPWGVSSEDQIDLPAARQVLDDTHAGLDDVKQRILEFIAVAGLRGEVAGSILLLVGPPGVGKTSIGRAVAESLGRRFYRLSLGGMRDEAEIKGHRRTYIGAMPGKLAQALKEVETDNPVIMLDEVDKLGASFQGDPASALLEVLDPEQNREFLDHYLDVRLDLSKVLFICTANTPHSIPGPLLDRMEVIRLAGYITEEKVDIARRFLLPRVLERTGLTKSQLGVTDAAMRRIIDGYAREAGVRNLEKQLGRIARKVAVQRLDGDTGRVQVAMAEVEHYLGKPDFHPERTRRGVGLTTGLAWTSMGGDTLTIEATLVHSKNRGFKVTGQLGDVMQESAQIAYSYIAAQLETYGGRSDFFDEAYVHLHVPAGATPKDGPSAGVTLATALLSLARGKASRAGLAMTGELTLTGEVLPVGGIREKVVAARRAKVKRVILPELNRKDFEEIPEYVRQGIEAHFVSRFAEVAEIAFGG